VGKLLRRMGLTRLQRGPTSRRRMPLRRRLLKKLRRRVAEILPPEAAGKTIEVWFQDEARVGQQGTLSYLWAPRGSRPPAVRDNRHDSAYIFGAICPARAVGAAIVMPWVSSEAMTIHLAEIAKQVSANAHAMPICDGAGWHQTGQRLSVPATSACFDYRPTRPSSTRSRTSGSICVAISSACGSGRATRTSSRHAARLGMRSSPMATA